MPLSDLVLGFAAPSEKPSTIARLGLSDVAVDRRYLIYDKAKGVNGKAAVEDSDDLQRIMSLPRRPRPTMAEREAMAAALTAWLRRDRNGEPCDCAALNPSATARGVSPCITEFNAIQGWYLHEAGTYHACLGFIPVGGGKTGIDIMIPMVLPNCRTYVLLLPPELVDQFNRDYRLWSQHFKVPNLAGGTGPFDPTRPTLRVLKYSELSRKNFATWLATMQPDALGCDEVQALKRIDSVRGNRFLRFFEDYGDPRPDRAFPIRGFGHSGSLTTRGLEDYSSLSAVFLREGSPVPLEPATAVKWALAINPAIGRAPAPMGALRHLCAPGQKLREAFRNRLVETPGIITTGNEELPIRLRIRKRDPGPIPGALAVHLGTTRVRQKRPDGEELVEHVEVVKVCRQLASGFYYKWRYPDVRDEAGAQLQRHPACPECGDGTGLTCPRCAVIKTWFTRRQEWARELKDKLEYREDLLDSPELCEDAAKRALGLLEDDGPDWTAITYAPWAAIKPRVIPVKETVWLDDFLVKDACRWIAEGPGICWFLHSAVGEALAKATGLPCYWGKDRVENLRPTKEMQDARAALMRLKDWRESAASWLGVESGKRPILVSLKAFHKGVNLQVFNRALYTGSPSDNGIWEQSLGRPHRFGQQAPEVVVDVYRHTPEVAAALDDAKEYAKYTFETTEQAERLLYATYEF